jgi:hypothetical protein
MQYWKMWFKFIIVSERSPIESRPSEPDPKEIEKMNDLIKSMKIEELLKYLPEKDTAEPL